MWDPFTWSLPLARLFGINIRVHVLFPVVAVGLVLRVAYQKDVLPGTWADAAMLMALLFGVVLLHEFGHCAGARFVDGDAHQILLWPLGGLAAIEVPHTPRANAIATAAGPAVNFLICLAAGFLFLFLSDFKYRPPWNPLPGGEYGWYPYRVNSNGAIELFTWQGGGELEGRLGIILLARLFWVSWVMFLLNVVLIGFPMDGGRLFQCALWPRWGFRQSMQAAIYAGFLTALVLGLVSIFANEILFLCLALFIYVTCRQQWILLETGGEDSVFGYDFSQGYTSLERDQPARPRRRRPNFWQRWRQQRAARKMQREAEVREAEERRMDELLEKVQREGLRALTDEERRFLKRVSDKYRNRQ
jgi:Zn-dependent protease